LSNDVVNLAISEKYAVNFSHVFIAVAVLVGPSETALSGTVPFGIHQY